MIPARPFNRAEYYIDNTAVPQRCAPNTGVLVKAVVAHDASGTTPTLLPLLDCVADLQLVYGLDNNADGVVDNWTDTLDTLGTPTRRRISERNLRRSTFTYWRRKGSGTIPYTYPATTIPVGSKGFVNNFDVSAYRNYRWKVYNIVVRPKNLAADHENPPE